MEEDVQEIAPLPNSESFVMVDVCDHNKLRIKDILKTMGFNES